VGSYNEWTEVVQVVHVAAQLAGRGLPEEARARLLQGGEVPLVLSLLVGGAEGTASQYQVGGGRVPPGAHAGQPPARRDPPSATVGCSRGAADPEVRNRGPRRCPLPSQVLALALSQEEGAAAAAAGGPGALPEPEHMPALALPLGAALREDSPLRGALALQREGALVVAGPERLEGAGWREVRLVVNGAAFKGRLDRVVVALRGRSERFVRGRCGAKFACAALRFEPAGPGVLSRG
jgi:hypothetical protein